MDEYITNSDLDTFRLAKKFGKAAKSGDIFCLDGDLGAGKTVFAKGFAEGLGVTSPVTSPTFTIINVHEGRLPFYHFDVYRIQNVDEMEDTGFEDYFYSDGVCLIEWASLIQELLPDNAIRISIEKDIQDENRRKLYVH